MRYVLNTKPTSCEHNVLGELSVTCEVPVFEDLVDFVENGCGKSEERALEWINGHVKTDANNEGRLELRNAEATKEELATDAAKATFISRLYTTVRATVKAWTAEVSKRKGTGVKAKASLFDVIASEVAAGKTLTPARFAELQAQYGVKV